MVVLYFVRLCRRDGAVDVLVGICDRVVLENVP